MRFLADMGVSLRVVSWLRSQGHDVRHLREEGLQRLPDDQILAKADREGRVTLTFDLDFSDILAFSGGRIVSVVLFRLHNTRTPFVIQRLAAVLSHCSRVLEEGAIVVVDDWRHRVRRLPLSPSAMQGL